MGEWIQLGQSLGVRSEEPGILKARGCVGTEL